MCGIVGYIGSKNVINILIDGLERLEYRGYDSAGISVLADETCNSYKSVGKVKFLKEKIDSITKTHDSQNLSIGIAHTRWATHGAPSEANAHPHLSQNNRFAIVHNGIIENYASLKSNLKNKGYKFKSETDSEVIVHLISEFYKGDLAQAVVASIKKLEGTFGIAAISVNEPDKIIVARRGSPIVIGVGNGENIIASDVSALVAHTKDVIYLNDNDIAVVTKDNVEIRNIDNIQVSREISKIEWDVGAAEKGGFEHFMLKEIYEQPNAINNTIRGRLDTDLASSKLSGLQLTAQELVDIPRVVVAACGTSLHAGMMAKYFFEELADLPTDIEQAAEFRYRNPIIAPRSMVIAISQSGETADTLAAVREAMLKGAKVAGLCNVVGSTIARETGRGIYLHAGPEIGVASTKAFTCQVAALLMMAMKFGRSRRLSRQNGIQLIKDIQSVPDLVQKVVDRADDIRIIAEHYAKSEDFFFIGRGYLYPVALEGALKLKEISYVHAEGYHAAELKHGPIALLEENVPVIALANDIPGKDKMIGNIQECKARKSPVVALATEGDSEIEQQADHTIFIPPCSPIVSAIPSVVALQLFSYYVARARGCSIDQPRNLAKSVTVE